MLDGLVDSVVARFVLLVLLAYISELRIWACSLLCLTYLFLVNLRHRLPSDNALHSSPCPIIDFLATATTYDIAGESTLYSII